MESVVEQSKVKLSHYMPGQTLRAPEVLRLPEFLNNRHMKMVRFQPYAPTALSPRKYPLHLSEFGSTAGPHRGGMIKSIKTPSEPTGNRTL
jgi:hypothetical protein